MQYEAVIVICKYNKPEFEHVCEKCPIHILHKRGIIEGDLICIDPLTPLGEELIRALEKVLKSAVVIKEEFLEKEGN